MGFYLLDADYVRRRYLEAVQHDDAGLSDDDDDDAVVSFKHRPVVAGLAVAWKMITQGVSKFAELCALLNPCGSSTLARSSSFARKGARRMRAKFSGHEEKKSSMPSRKDGALPSLEAVAGGLGPLPPWQTLRGIKDSDGLPVVRYFKMSRDALLQQAFAGSVLAVSHRWQTATQPDPDGAQFQAIAQYLLEHGEIYYVWIECARHPHCVRSPSLRIRAALRHLGRV